MSYKIKQISKEPDSALISALDKNNLQYMTPIRHGEVGKYAQPGDSSDSGALSSVSDECVYVKLTKDVHYYFHGQIKRAGSALGFNIKLIKRDDVNKIQFVKKINVKLL